MSGITVSRPLQADIEPIKEKRLELGKKVFKVPTQSKRKSSRIQRPEASAVDLQKKPTPIVHHLLLAPTLKRQRKKKLEREKKHRHKRYFNNTKLQIKVADVFAKKRCKRRESAKRRRVTIILDDAKVRAVRKTKTIRNLFQIRHLARCGGVQNVTKLDVFEEIERESTNDSDIPPPFEAKDEDPYILPQPGQLISYIWHTRPSPVLGRKQIYRTGILCSTDGTIRFFESDDDCPSNNNQDRTFFEGRFYLNKNVFKMGNFRVRTDLVEGAICYERERELPCKILKIDEESGAVLVECLEAREGISEKHLWISPDDLVGNYNYMPTDQTTQNIQWSNTKPSEQIGQISPTCVSSSTPETIDLTEDDEEELNLPAVCTPETASPRYTTMDTLDRGYVPHMQAQMATLENERSVARIVSDVCKSLPPSAALSSNLYNRGSDFRSPNPYEALENTTWQTEQSKSILSQYVDEHIRTPDTAASIMARAATLGSPIRPQTVSDRFGIMDSPSPISTHSSGVGMQSELGLVKQHGMALEILMAAKDLGTILAILQYIRRLQQRGIPVGPTAAKLVSNAEKTSRALIDDNFLRHMTTPIWSGGRGYDMSHAGLLLCRLTPVLGPSLGNLDSPIVNKSKLMGLGLNQAEISDILPYLQQLEDDILMKTLKFKRQLSSVY